MGDLDDGPDQRPLEEKEVQELILDLLPGRAFSTHELLTHRRIFYGEYTRRPAAR